MTDLYQGPIPEMLTQAQVNIGKLETEVAHLREDMSDLKASNAALVSAVAGMQRTLSEASGGWKMLMLMGGAGAMLGSVLAWVVDHIRAGS